MEVGGGGGGIEPFCKLLCENQSRRVPYTYDTRPTLVHIHVLVTPPLIANAANGTPQNSTVWLSQCIHKTIHQASC